jgi:rubrerythrin
MGRIKYILNPKEIRKELKKERKELEEQAAEAEAKSKHLPKEFNYYCPSCLFQAKEDIDKCPKCGHSPLAESDR